MLLSIPASQRAAYQQTIRGVHERKFRAALLDRNGDTVANLALLDGQIVVDAKQDVPRSATVRILDPRHALGFDADTYQGQELDLSRMLRVWWIVDGPLLAKPISIPVHTGPIVRLRRDGPVVTIEAQGKEAYGLTPTRKTLTIKKGARRTDAIKTILRHRMGETRLSGIPNLRAKLPSDFTVGPRDLAFKKAEALARSLDRQLFYGADGVPYLRKEPVNPVWTFRADHPQGDVTGSVSTTADLQSVKNVVRVTGATPKGKKKPVGAVEVADRLHPLSPWQLGPTGSPMYLIEEISNPNLRTDRECREVAKRVLRARLKLLHETAFDAIPVPHLEPKDLIAVRTHYESAESELHTFTLPIGVGGDMTVGYVERYRLRRKGRR